MMNVGGGGPATAYCGPVATTELSVGGLRIKVVRPAEPDRLLDDPEVLALNRRDDYMPYWAYLWPGSFLLAEAVAASTFPASTRALEIGCGLGLPGLVALARGLHVRFTDYDPAPLAFVRASAEANAFPPDRYETAVLDWRDPPPTRFPLTLAADVLYEPRLVPLVARLLAAALESGGLALIADPGRVAALSFPSALSAVGLTTEAAPVHASTSEWGEIRGTLHRVARTSAKRPEMTGP